MTTETPILILALAGLSMHHGALGAVRSAGRLGIPVFYAHRTDRSPIDQSRYSRGGVILPCDPGGERTLEVLREFAAANGRAVLLAVDDASAMFVADHSEVLRNSFLFPRQPDGLARMLADKRRMHRLCVEHAVPAPLAAFPQSSSEVLEHAERIAFPVVAKRIDASLGTGSPTPNVLVAQDPAELLESYGLMESAQAPNVMLQEYIPGVADANWMFNGYFDADSRSRVSFTGVKLRQAPPDAGATTLGVCKFNHEVTETTERFMGAVGYRGILDIDYRLDRRDGRYKLLDVNPRIGSSFRLFAAADGTDVLQAMYLDLTGQELPSPAAQQEGRRWIVEPQDLQTSLCHLRRGELTVHDWLKSVRRVDEAAWWARDDPRPFFAIARSLSISRARRLLRAGRTRLRLGRRWR
jgi:D-aspartate ligase